jgi:hypothetical protein
MKKLLTGASVAALVLGLAGTASAAVSDDSSLTVTNNFSMDIMIRNINRANISNSIGAFAFTGGNTITGEDDVNNSTLTTGDADAWAEVENHANNNMTHVDVNVESAGASAGGIEVSDDSDATLTTTESIDYEVTNQNDAEVSNDASSSADTGLNSISGEDVEGVRLETGRSRATTVIYDSINNSDMHAFFTLRRAR